MVRANHQDKAAGALRDFEMESHQSAQQYELAPHVSRAWSEIPANCRRGKVHFATELANAVRERGQDPAFMVDKLIEYYKSPEGRGMYRLKAANFIDQGSYDDDPSAWKDHTGPVADAAESSGVVARCRRWAVEANTVTQEEIQEMAKEHGFTGKKPAEDERVMAERKQETQ